VASSIAITVSAGCVVTPDAIMTTGPDGSFVRAEDRVSEILSRYPEDDPVHRAIERSAPTLLAAVARVDALVAG
jgi:hypothetical protein